MSDPRQLIQEAHDAVLSIIRERDDRTFVVADLWAVADSVAAIESARGHKEERERENEECAKLVDDWIAKYPAEMFQRPEDAMLREVLRNVAEDIRCRIAERTVP